MVIVRNTIFFLVLGLGRSSLWLALGLGVCTPGLAQTRSQGGTLGGPVPAATPSTEALFGDLWDTRRWLAKHGVTVSIDDENEFGGNVAGGVTREVSNAGQLGWGFDIDWGTLAGWRGLSTHVSNVTRYGQSASFGFGDTLDPSQQVYGGGGNTAAHLVLAFAEQKLQDGKYDISVGRMGLLNNFDASTLDCTFMNNMICGVPKASTDVLSNSVYPKAVWGANVRYTPFKAWTFSTGIYANDQSSNRSGWHFTTAHTDGVSIPFELEFRPDIGAAHLTGRIKIGGSYASAPIADVLYDVHGRYAVLTGQPARMDQSYPGVWFVADQMIHRNGPGADEGLWLMLRFNHNDPRIVRRAEQYIIALVDNGFWRARPKDSFGIIFSSTTISSRWSQAQAIALQHGLTPPFGWKDQIHPGIAYQPQRFAQVLEMQYRIHVGYGIMLGPDFQYFWNVNGQRNIPNAVFFGMRGHVQVF